MEGLDAARHSDLPHHWRQQGKSLLRHWRKQGKSLPRHWRQQGYKSLPRHWRHQGKSLLISKNYSSLHHSCLRLVEYLKVYASNQPVSTAMTSKIIQNSRYFSSKTTSWWFLVIYCTFLWQVLPIYMHIRVLVSSYLFLSAFGHFYYFYAKADYSFRRVCVVRMCFTATVSENK